MGEQEVIFSADRLQAYRSGVRRAKQEESLNVALMVGRGSVILLTLAPNV